LPSTPSRFEVEHLHRLMMQASLEAAQLDRRTAEEQRSDGLSVSLRGWQDAADGLHSAFSRASVGLLRDGTPKDQLDRIRERLVDLESRSFDVDEDLDRCVEHWQALGHEFAQLSGEHRDALVSLLQSRKSRIDQVTSELSTARKTGGMAPEKHRNLLELQGRRDHARDKYERLRQRFVQAEQDWRQAERQKVDEKRGALEHATKLAPLPNLSSARKGPLLVRLPETAEGKKVRPPPPPKNEHKLPHVTAKTDRLAQHEVEEPALKVEKKIDAKKLEPKKRLEPKAGRKREQAVSGPPRISIERFERIAGYATAQDGIGRGSQVATLLFRAENLPPALQVQGVTSINLGCSVRLDVLPSVQLLSSTPGAPTRGRVALTLLSSGGRLGTVSPQSALEAARQAARAASSQVAAKLGIIGKQLESAIGDVLEDAAGKIFSRAQLQAVPNKLPVRQAGPGHEAQEHQHHVGRFNHALGHIITQAREVKGGRQHKHKLSHLLERDHHHRDSVAARLETTLSHLATATHRTLTDSRAGEMRNHLARMDAILARLRGSKAAHELAQGAHELGSILHKLGTSAAQQAGAPHVNEFKKLIEERKGQLQKIAKDAGHKQPKLHEGALGRQAHSTGSLTRDLHALRRLNPGLDKLLKEASHSQLVAELGKAVQKGVLSKLHKGQPHKGGLGSQNLNGLQQSLGGGHLGGFGGGHRGGLSALSGSALGKALEKHVDNHLRGARPGEVARLINHFNQAAKGSPLHELAKRAEEKRARLATQNAGRKHAHVPASALHEVFKHHPNPQAKAFAGKLAPGGALHQLCHDAQRGHGLPIGAAAQHYLANRGHSQILGAVQTFNTLLKAGHRPRFSLWGDLTGAVSSAASSVSSAVARTVSKATTTVSSLAQAVAGTVRAGVSDFGNSAGQFAKRAASTVGDVVQRAGRGANRLYGAMKHVGQEAWGGLQRAGRGISNLAGNAFHAMQTGASWAARKAGSAIHSVQHLASGAIDWAKHKAAAAGHFVSDKVQAGLEWAKKTGIAGGLKGLAAKGLHALGNLAKSTPLGWAINKGYGFVKSGGLSKVWNGAKSLAGKAWGGIRTAYKATSGFLKSPAGQLLVTGLSLAASFIPGGMVVKALVGGAVGAIQAVSEGKSWKGVLASAAGGALTGALPFLKIGPLAKIGMGALQGGISTLAGGGSFKDALKGAAGGVIDSFDPGAFGALKRLKGLTSAEKLLTGKNLSKAEKEFMAASKFVGPLRGLEKVMANPRARRVVGGLEQAGGKAVKGGIWLSGKAGKVQGVLEKVMGAGDKVHGVLTQVHDLAPGLADILGDNPAGHFVRDVGGWAGKGDEKLEKALEYGHTASDKITQYKGNLDKGLGYAGVKDRKKAYEKMQARKDLSKNKKGALEQLKRAEHKTKHAKKPLSRLEKALAKGKELEKKGLHLAQGAHDKLGHVHDVVAKGLGAADKVQNGLEKAAELARQGSELLGDDSELGNYLGQMADRTDAMHGYLEKGIGFATSVNGKLSAVHDGLEEIHGVHKDGEEKHKKKSPLERAQHLDGKHAKKVLPHETHSPQKRPHELPAPTGAHETEAQKSERLKHAWTALSNVSRRVRQFESEYAKTSRKIDALLSKGKGNEASIELMGLGSSCEDISKAVADAKRLSKGHDSYEKECKFYGEWHKTTAAKLHAAIAHAKGLGKGVQISGFGFDEKTHPDIFENTQDIFAIDAKVKAFGVALSDHDAAPHVKSLLAEAKAAKARLSSLKSKYKQDKTAYEFLAGGGQQDKLIDRSIAAIEKGLGGSEHPSKKNETHGKPTPKHEHKHAPGKVIHSAEHGLKQIEALKKKALKAGRKIDSRLTKIERALNTGIRAGKKVDSGLEKIAGVAGQVTSALGADSPMGHLAEQVEHAAKGGHDKLHAAIHGAQKGKSFLHKGHELFDSALKLASRHQEKALEKVYGKKPANAEHQHGLLSDVVHLAQGAAHLYKDGKRTVHDAKELVHDGKHGWTDARHAWGSLKKGDWKGALAGGKTLLGDAKSIFGDGKHLPQDGKEIASAGKHVVGDISHLLHAGKEWVHANLRNLDFKNIIGQAEKAMHILPEWLKGVLGKKASPHDPQPKHHHKPHPPSRERPPKPEHDHAPHADSAQAVHAALSLVQRFGKAVTSAVKDIEASMHAGDAKKAGDRVQSVTSISEQTRAAVAEAVAATAGSQALAKQAAQASAHYLELRKHFFDFIKGLHGLGSEPVKVDAKKYPDLEALSTDLGSLQVKADALGQLKNADTQMQPMVAELQKELAGLKSRLTKAESQYASDAAAGAILEQLANHLQQIEKQLGAHAGKSSASQGDRALGQKKKRPEPKKKQVKKHDPVAQILDGDDGRIHVDRGGNRGDVNVQDGQEIDSAAMDTWIGSGEGVELFSQVFGAFLPAEGGAILVQHRGTAGGAHAHGSTHGGPGRLPGNLEHGALEYLHDGKPGGLIGGSSKKKKKTPGGLGKPGSGVSGFFSKLFDHLHSFSDEVSQIATEGSGLLGQGMHYAELGEHALSKVEGASKKVEDIAAKAEGILGKMGLGSMAGMAHKIGGAAGYVDKEAAMLHGGLKTADEWMGKGKKLAGETASGAEKASGVFAALEHGKFGALANLFKSSRDGAGIDGKLSPEKARLGSLFDEPRRLDGTTLSKMSGFLGGDFANVRVHTGMGAAEVTSRFHAEAVTVKDHIFFAPGRFSPTTVEGQKLLAHELTHVLQMGRPNLDVRTAEGEALHSEHSYGSSPDMTTLSLKQAEPDFKLADGQGLGNASGVHTAKRNRSKGHEATGKDKMPDGDEFLEAVSGRVYDLLMEEMEQSFESR
jgi:Domain of unknown function (DUF4157)